MAIQQVAPIFKIIKQIYSRIIIEKTLPKNQKHIKTEHKTILNYLFDSLHITYIMQCWLSSIQFTSFLDCGPLKDIPFKTGPLC